MKKVFSGLLLATSLTFLNAQDFTRQQVTEELSFLREEIIRLQPGLQVFTPTFEQESRYLIQKITSPCDTIGLYAKASRVAALAGEGHYTIGNWHDAVHKGFLNNRYRYFPFTIRLLGHRMYLWHNYSGDQSLEKGREILAINGQNITEIINLLSDHIPADGKNSSFIREEISRGFQWMYYLFIATPDTFRLLFDDQEEKVIPALKRSEMIRNYRKDKNMVSSESTINKNEVYELILHKNHALLRLKTFDRYSIEKQNLHARTFYEDLFRKLRSQQLNNLIIDLRGNMGGLHEFAFEILSFVKSHTSMPYFKTTVPKEGKQISYPFPPKEPLSWEGKIYVLVNGLTYSAAASMARYLREYCHAVIIGQETGSRYEGFAAGAREMIVLPHSGIHIGVPKYATFFPPSQRQTEGLGGMYPDIFVEPGIDDLLSEVDPELDTALRLIYTESPMLSSAQN
ncbi:S41 family peptidase [Robertkochia aurantiaca]|uniref:S41 family peptidase n=1 Tax=Robertkochia aurantiaca TaxID=2873700 RepID=UPI001CCFE5FD|nr:S41 family peptidase [Robertkochia sp. 3YJGBD-33]